MICSYCGEKAAVNNMCSLCDYRHKKGILIGGPVVCQCGALKDVDQDECALCTATHKGLCAECKSNEATTTFDECPVCWECESMLTFNEP